MKIHHPKTIEEAINDIEEFFKCDMWYAKEAEWKTEKDMIKYLKIHFNILKGEIKRISNQIKIRKPRRRRIKR